MAARTAKCRNCPALVERQAVSGLCRACYEKDRSARKPSQRVLDDRERARVAAEYADLRKRYDHANATVERQERELKAMGAIGTGLDTFKIAPRKGSGDSEGTAVMVASDWHSEEVVKPATVNGLNEHNPDIAKARSVKFFQSGLRLVRLLQQDIKIDNLVLPLLGDFISNDIHEEFPENNALQPIHATLFAQNLIASGIEFLLEHSKLNLVIPCHSGNHARTTKTVRVSSEAGHSLEYLMYRSLAGYFRGESDRVKFIIPEGYHSYMDVYGRTIRFHHGHEIRYQGGVGGIYIPVNKAISQWNKGKWADLDVFGHFHQARDGGNFICNGSSIGYNAFGLSIKADCEDPKQQLFLMDKQRGRTCTWPILVK